MSRFLAKGGSTPRLVLRIVRYRIGVFKGQRAVMAAVYGFSKGGKSLS
ncbi:MAG: hypothetical protein M2R45_05248 [Verrucomicrobia subdivision 3 bacterium]|nr:hypothetical protein [Limisphaerales bacterium]MCS1416847.1 hypothetical protein [Limisphaerales bacterium]